MLATLRLRTEQLSKLRRLAGIETDIALAARMNVDAGTISRVLRGKQSPSPRFIASLVEAFDGMDFADLFEVVPGHARDFRTK